MIARLILLLVFSLSWLPAPSAWAAATAPQLPRVRIAYSSISSIFAGLWVAKEAGVFEKYGLRGELLYIGAGSVAVQAMMGGEVEVVPAPVMPWSAQFFRARRWSRWVR